MENMMERVPSSCIAHKSAGVEKWPEVVMKS